MTDSPDYGLFLDDPPPFVEYKTIELEKLRIALREIISPELLGTKLEVEQYARHILVKLEGYLWHETLDEWSVKYPADWWQAFKERWFSPWALNHWPVQYKSKKVVLRALYPDYKVAMPHETYRLQLTELE